MRRTVWTVSDVRRVLASIAAEQPERRDRRAAAGLGCKYVDGGQPSCRVAEIMCRLGVTIGVLRQLDREASSPGTGITLASTKHRVRRRFTPAAWDMLAALQALNDAGRRWGMLRG